MVKKIQGGPGRPIGSEKIGGTRAVETTRATDVKGVTSTQAQTGTQRIERRGQQITPEIREQLYELIVEEAEKLFGEEGMSSNKRKQVESAVRMAIDASMLDPDEIQSSKNKK